MTPLVIAIISFFFFRSRTQLVSIFRLLITSILCPFHRKTCQACKCPRENHEIYHEQLQNVRERLGFKIDSKTSQIEPKKLGFTWTPPGILTSSKIQRYFDQLPQEKVPKIGSNGEKYRDKQLAYQLPRQDLTINYCKHVDTEHRASYDDFIAARNEIALDVGFVRDATAAGKCQMCSEAINQGEMCVNAPKLSDDVSWKDSLIKLINWWSKPSPAPSFLAQLPSEVLQVHNMRGTARGLDLLRVRQ